MEKELEKYKKYVGSFVKRFYQKNSEYSIFKIKDFRLNKFGMAEFLYYKEEGEYWSDVEDSIIITDEMPIIEDERIENVNYERYKGFNPYNK